MKRIYREKRVKEALSKSRYRETLESLPVKLFLTEYEAGELLSAPEDGGHLIQIVVEGALSIYYIRDDGSSYALAISERDEILGNMEFFGGGRSDGVFAEVTQKLTCLAFSTPENREALLNNAAFLRMIAKSLARIVETLTVKNAAQPSLRERLYAYMVYKCECGRLKGVEKAAFHLHCSPRQLQRILNELVRDGVARKTGKGAYELCPGATETEYDG